MNADKKKYLISLLGQKYSKKTKESSVLSTSDTSAMGDVAFLLLIFFIVTTSFILRQGIFFTLPSKNEGAQKIEENMLMKLYPEEQGFLYEGKKIGRDELEEQLKMRLAQQKDLIVLIYMKEDVPYRRLVETLSAVKEEGVRRVSVKTVSEESS